MNHKILPFAAPALAIIGFVLFEVAHATAIAVDATSGASGSRKMVTISAIDVTQSTAAISYSEGETNGSFRFYYTTTAFSSAADTTRANVTKMSVSPRGRGTLNLTNLTAGTKYYYRFQGYYQKGTSNYWATGTLTALGSTAIAPRSTAATAARGSVHDVLGRPHGNAAGIAVGSTRSDLVLRR